MDHEQDPDAVLRTLGEDLARDDPRLAALLGEVPGRRPRRRRPAVLFLLLCLVVVALLVPPTVALGAIALVLAAGAPFAVCWLCAEDPPDDRAH